MLVNLPQVLQGEPPEPGPGVIPPAEFRFPLTTETVDLTSAEIVHLACWYNDSFGIDLLANEPEDVHPPPHIMGRVPTDAEPSVPSRTTQPLSLQPILDHLDTIAQQFVSQVASLYSQLGLALPTPQQEPGISNLLTHSKAQVQAAFTDGMAGVRAELARVIDAVVGLGNVIKASEERIAELEERVEVLERRLEGQSAVL
ncbi:hypothetical protein HDU96_006818 [Phlyctochytrium bullatum]|nr:hypothetical protein HDU96_006818 [Phlyctochytrium bullatum]